MRSNDELSNVGGVALVGRVLDKIGFSSLFESRRTADILKAHVALLCQGRADFNDIEAFRGDGFFCEALGLKRVPSEATLRQRADGLSEADLAAIRRAWRAELDLAPLKPARTAHGEYVPVDVDVSPFDNSGTKKEGVSRTYMGFDGYSPNFAYAGAEGVFLHCELREGSAHSQAGTPGFLRDCAEGMRGRAAPGQTLFRMDAGCDAYENLRVLREAGCHVLVKRNLRRESKEMWIERAKALGDMEQPRPGKRVWTGSVAHVCPPPKDGGPEIPLFAVFRVVERTSDAKGQAFLVPECEVHTWWTSLPDAPEEVVELYRQHAASEQHHSEFKSDLGVERLPSGKFATNAAVLMLAAVAYNVLRLIDQEALLHPEDMPVKAEASRRRVGSVIRDLVFVAAKRVRHAGRVFLKFGRLCPWFKVFRAVYERFAPAPDPAPASP